MYITAALVAVYVATSTAFLIPPHISDDFQDSRFRGGPPEHVKEFIHHLLEERTTTVDLKCHDCHFALPAIDEEEQYLAWSEEPVDSSIHLELKADGGILNLNGQPLYPINNALEASSVKQITAEQWLEGSDRRTQNIPLEFALSVEEPMPSPHKDGVILHKVELTILGLDGMPVKVNTLALKLVQIPTGDLVLVRTDEIPFEETPGADTCEGTRSWSLCRLRAVILDRMRTMLEAAQARIDRIHGWTNGKLRGGCHSKRPHGAGQKHEGGHRHHRGPHAHHRHHGHHKGHRYHRVSHMFHQTFRFFVIPALLGVIGGLVASAVGMLVGQAIIMMWFRTYRQGRRGPVRVEREVVVVAEDEKHGLMSEQIENPPVYEDSPSYHDSIVRDVEAEAVASTNDEKHS